MWGQQPALSESKGLSARAKLGSAAGAAASLFRFCTLLKWNCRCYFRSSRGVPNLYRPSLRRYREETMGSLRASNGRNSDLNPEPNNEQEEEPENDRRREPRTHVDLSLTVWGIDTRGDRFLQEARARDISLSGALLSGLDAELRSGDVIGILYGGKKARYRVVWVRESGNGLKVQAAVHRIAPDECPWKELLAEERPGDASRVNPAAPQAIAEN